MEAALCEGIAFDEGARGDGTCEPDGWWAIKVTLDSWWDLPEGDIGLDNRGTTTLHLLQKVELDEGSDEDASITTYVCRQVQPPSISDILCAAFATVIPEETFEKLPPIESRGKYSCLEKNADCGLTMEFPTTFFGLAMSDPDLQPIPPTALDIECDEGTAGECFPDEDGDGNPGVTATFLDSEVGGDGTLEDHSDCPSQGRPYQYRYAPPSSGLSALTDTVQWVHGGSRIRFGTLVREIDDSCGCGVQRGVVETSDQRVISCEVRELDGSMRPCEPAEADFIDARANPNDRIIAVAGEVPDAALEIDSHAPSPGPLFRGIRLGGLDAEFDCGDVLGAMYPEPDISLAPDPEPTEPAE